MSQTCRPADTKGYYSDGMLGRATLVVALSAVAPTAAAEEESKPIAGYDGGFFVQSPDGNFKAVVGGRVQFRFSFEEPDEGPYESAFSIPRARLQLNGHAFTPDLTYEIQTDFGKGELPTLKDGYADYRFVDGWLQLRAGQFKKPLSRQQLTSSTKFALVDRSPLDDAFRAGRDLGVMLHNGWKGSPPFEYQVGVFNGPGDEPLFDAGDGSFSNVPSRFSPLAVARVAATLGGIDGYDEIDRDGDFGVSLAANAQARFNLPEDDAAFTVFGGDFMVKGAHVALHGEALALYAQQGARYADQALESVGLMVGVSYLIADTLAPGLRLARVVEGSDAHTTELCAGVAVLVFDHNFKVTSDAGPIITHDGGERSVDARWRTQLQLQL